MFIGLESNIMKFMIQRHYVVMQIPYMCLSPEEIHSISVCHSHKQELHYADFFLHFQTTSGLIGNVSNIAFGGKVKLRTETFKQPKVPWTTSISPISKEKDCKLGQLIKDKKFILRLILVYIILLVRAIYHCSADTYQKV